jgi:hypothetical protein
MDRISNILFSLFRRTPQHGDWVVACLEGSWPAILGDSIAQVCTPIALRGTALIVEIRDPAWEPALESMKDELSARLRKASGGNVQKLYFTQKP